MVTQNQFHLSINALQMGSIRQTPIISSIPGLTVPHARTSQASFNSSSSQSPHGRHSTEMLDSPKNKVHNTIAHIASMDHEAPRMQIVFQNLVYTVQVGSAKAQYKYVYVTNVI